MTLPAIQQSGWETSGKDVRIPKTGGRPLLKRSDVPGQTGPNDYYDRAGESPGYFTIITESEAPTSFVWATLFVCDSSHRIVLYSKEKMETLVNNLAMREITISPNSIFIVNG